MFVVRLIQTRSSEVPWHFRHAWHNFLTSLSFIQVHVSHIYREKNFVADKLSNIVLSLSGETWWPTFPSEYFDLMRNDAMGWHSFQFH